MHSTRTRFQQLRSVSLPVIGPRVAALLVVVSFAALGAVGCDNHVDVEPGSGAPSTGGGSGTSTGAGAGGATGSGGEGAGTTSTGTAGSGTTTTVEPECVSDGDCLDISKPVCDPETGTCVLCLPGPDDVCPQKKYCSNSSMGYVCKPGCKDDADCNAGPGPDVFTCDPIAHQCLGCSADEHCPPGSICDAATNQCKPGCSAQKPCDPNSNTKDCCGSTCVNLLGDIDNCGTCGNVCEVNLPNANGICSLGTCKISCNIIGFVDCNKVVEDGCEVDVGADPLNCGGCGNKCSAGPNMQASCVSKQCEYTCEPGFLDCDQIDANGCEANLTSDANNCGGCGNKCSAGPNMQASCVSKQCSSTCEPGFLDCDLDESNGCEADASSDPSNCGGCGNLCFGQGTCTFACVAGLCSSASCACPFADCDGNVANGCETDTSTDVAHCGSCQTACGAGQVCTAGVCL